MHSDLYNYSHDLIKQIKDNKIEKINFSNTLTEEECRKVFSAINEAGNILKVDISHSWTSLYQNGRHAGYFDTISFHIKYKNEYGDYHCFRVTFDHNLININNPWNKTLPSNDYYSKRLTKHICIFRELFKGEDFLMIPSHCDVIAIRKEYVDFHYTTRTQSSFSLISKKAPRVVLENNIIINKKSSGWISSTDNYEKNVFLAVNKEYFKSLCETVDNAITKIIEENRSTKLAAFSLEFGAKQIKFDSFVGITGVKEDVRNLNSEIFMRIVSDFQKSSSVFVYNEKYIDTKYLTKAFKLIKDGDSYKLVPSRSQDSSWYCFRMSEVEFNAMMDLAERFYDDPDELMAWRLLGELKDS